MHNFAKLVLTTAGLVVAFNGSAQPIFPDSIDDTHRVSGQNPQFYSQARSLTEKLPLDLMAVNDPTELESLPVIDMEGAELGKVLAIARRKTDQTLHAIVSTGAGEATAVRLDGLSLGALTYWDPAGTLDEQHFLEADYEPISQYQTGHSARGSLTDPIVKSAPTALDPASIEQSGDRRPVAAQIEQADEALRSGVAIPARPVYQPIDSSIVQLALTRPDAFEGILLVGAQGEALGQVGYIARNLTDQQLYAVVDSAEGGWQATVKLSALTAGQLFYQGHQRDYLVQQFDESEFETVPGR